MRQRFTFRKWDDFLQDDVYSGVVVDGDDAEMCFALAIQSGETGEIVEILDLPDVVG